MVKDNDESKKPEDVSMQEYRQLQERVETLKAACANYRAHFKEIYKNDKDMLSKFKEIDKWNVIGELVVRRHEGFEGPKNLALAKYMALRDLTISLAQKEKYELPDKASDADRDGVIKSDNTKSIEGFDKEFKQYRQLFEKRRDTAADTFLKVVATVLTLGIAAALGIWKVHGKEQFTKKIDQCDVEQSKGKKHTT